MDQEQPDSVDLVKQELEKVHAQLAGLQQILTGMHPRPTTEPEASATAFLLPASTEPEAPAFHTLPDLDHLPVAAWLLDSSGRFISVNRKMSELLDYLHDELAGARLVEFLDEECRAHLLVHRTFLPRAGELYLCRFRPRERASRWAYLAANFLPHDHEGQVLGMMLDVTPGVEAERKLRQSEAFFRSLVEQIPAMLYSVPVQDGEAYHSPRTQALTGTTPEDWNHTQMQFAQRLHPDDRTRVMAEIASALSTGRPLSLEYRLLRPDGRTVWLRDQASVILDDEGQAVRLQGAIHDITEAKETEARLRAELLERDALFREAQQAVHDMLAIFCSQQQCQTRIRALAIFHQALARSREPGRLDLLPYLDALTAELYDTLGVSTARVRRELDVDAIDVHARAGLNLGLALNELVASALVHAFPEDRAGRILIEVRPRDDGLFARVSDDGVSQAEASRLQLVNAIVQRAGGSVKAEPGPGNTVSLFIPCRVAAGSCREPSATPVVSRGNRIPTE